MFTAATAARLRRLGILVATLVLARAALAALLRVLLEVPDPMIRVGVADAAVLLVAGLLVAIGRAFDEAVALRDDADHIV